jgi:hypothetical protein
MNPTVPLNINPDGDINCITWMWKSNNAPFDSKQSVEWTAYPPAVSASIERAYRRHESQICINENYMIDLNNMLQVCTDDFHRQRPVKRCALSDSDDNNIDWRRERFAFKLDRPIADHVKTNTSEDDVKYYGSRFIADWLLKFTNGKLDVKFDIIFPVLVHGIRSEGQLYEAPEETIKGLIDELEKVRDDVRRKSESERIKYLAKCCVKLYTKGCFLFKTVNATLRDDNYTKLNTLGPYCYLVYNYIGRRTYGYLSVRYRLRQQFRPTQAPSLLVYRGDSITKEKLEKYRHAAGQPHKYFKWLSFVSTSHKRNVGEFFANNVLYVIELRRAMSNDQFADLCDNTFWPHEEEVLLRPGVRFRVENVAFNSETGLHQVHIKIVPSYVSNLR